MTTGPSPWSPAAAAASAGPSPRRWPRPASTSPITDIADEAERRRSRRIARARRARPPICPVRPRRSRRARRRWSQVARPLRPHRLPGQQCRHGVAVVRGDLLDLQPENFDRVIARQSARHDLPDPGRGAGDAGGTPTTAPRSIVNITSVSADAGLARAARLLHLQGRARHVEQGSGAAAGARGHRRVRGPAGHHPHRHDRRRRRQIRRADRRRPGAGAALGRARATSAGVVAALAGGELRLRHRLA